MIFHPVIQNTEDPCPCCGKTWMELRAGKVTGSSIGKVMANYGKAFGDPAKRLAVDIAVVERGGRSTPQDYYNSHMERGHEEEPIARMKYEELTFCDVSNGGFYDRGSTGSSPDGNVLEDGLIEIKSVTNPTHYKCIAKQSYDPKYKWQLLFNLKVSGREWIDFVSYCATFPPNKRLFVHRLHRNGYIKEFDQIDKRLAEFRALVSATKQKIGVEFTIAT